MQVTDGVVTVTTDFTVTVTEVNVAPVLAALADRDEQNRWPVGEVGVVGRLETVHPHQGVRRQGTEEAAEGPLFGHSRRLTGVKRNPR